MDGTRQALLGRILSRLHLRFPALFVLFLALTVIDLIVPDFVPFVDELGLALLTAIFALWKRRREPAERP